MSLKHKYRYPLWQYNKERPVIPKHEALFFIRAQCIARIAQSSSLHRFRALT